MSLRSNGKRAEAIAFLKKQIRLLKDSPDYWDPWHEGEAHALIAMLYEETNNHKLAAKHYLYGGKVHRGMANGHAIAASERFARAALAYFKMGQKKKAQSIAKEAFALVKLDVDPSPTYEELLQQLRSYAFERAEERKKTHI